MKRLLLASFGVLSTVFILGSGVAHAATFNANNLIDDSVFSDVNTMTAAQIDAFLNTFPNSCISPNSGFAALDPTGYNPTNGYSFGGYVTAGQVIYDSAQAYGINPQVLLTTLQKEQSLVAGGVNFCENGDMNKYAAAVGYGCPDSGTTYSYSGVSLYRRNGVVASNTGITCVNSASKAGFSQQVIRGAWLLKFGQQRSEGNINWAVIKGNWDNSDDPQTCYGGPMTQGTFRRCPSGSTVSYDGYTTIDSTSVHMDNGATAALYWYTPHFHGNQSFDNIFQGWFGSLIGSDIVRTVNNPTIYLLSGTTKYPVADMNVWNDFSALGTLKYVSDDYINSYATGPVLGHMVGDVSGTLYFVNAGIKLPFSSCTSVSDYGYTCSSVTTLASYQLAKLATGPAITARYSTTTGRSYYIAAGQKREIFDSQSAIAAGINAPANTLLDGGINYLPLGTPIIRDKVTVTDRSTAQRYYYDASRYVSLPGDLVNFSAFTSLPQGNLDSLSIPQGQRYTNFKGFMTNTGGTNFYMLTSTGKVTLTNPGTWTTDYTQFSDAFLSGLNNDAAPINNALVKSANNPTVYYVIDKQKRPIPGWDDLVNLRISPLVINTVPSTILSALPDGALMFAPGRLIKSAASATVYVVGDATHLFPIASFLFPQELGITLSTATASASDLQTYTVGSLLETKVVCDGKNYIGSNGKLYEVTSSLMSAYGFTQQSFITGGAMCTNLPKSGTTLTDFMRVNNGTIYQVTGGQKHPIAGYDIYLAHGGTTTNTTTVSDYLASLIPTGSLITQ